MLPVSAPDLPSLLAALDARRTTFLANLEALPEPTLEQSPEPGAWSPLEIGEHLLRLEERFLNAAERQTHAGDDRRDLGEADEAAVEGLIQAMRSPARFRVPEGARVVQPEGALTLADLRVRWRVLAERWQCLVDGFPDALLNVALVRHPLAGPLCLRHTLRFLDAHLSHHEHQLTRTLAALDQAAP